MDEAVQVVRNLTDAVTMAGMTRERLRSVIRGGLPGTSMPAWGSVLLATGFGLMHLAFGARLVSKHGG